VVAVVVVDVVDGLVGSVSGFSGTGYSYPATASSDGQSGTPISRNSELFPTSISPAGMQLGILTVVLNFDVVVAGVVEVVVVVVIVEVVVEVVDGVVVVVVSVSVDV